MSQFTPSGERRFPANWPVPPPPPPIDFKFTVTDLPNELLSQIANQLFGHNRELVALCASCTRLRVAAQPVLFREFIKSPKPGKGLLHFARTVVCDRKDLAACVERIVVQGGEVDNTGVFTDEGYNEDAFAEVRDKVEEEGLRGPGRRAYVGPRERDHGNGPLLEADQADGPGEHVEDWLLVVLLARLPKLRVAEFVIDYCSHQTFERIRPGPEEQLGAIFPSLCRLDVVHGDTEMGFSIASLETLLLSSFASLEQLHLHGCAGLEGLVVELPRLRLLHLEHSSVENGGLTKTLRRLTGLESLVYCSGGATVSDCQEFAPWRLVKALVDSGVSRHLRRLCVDRRMSDGLADLDCMMIYTSLARDGNFPLLSSVCLTASDIFDDRAERHSAWRQGYDSDNEELMTQGGVVSKAGDEESHPLLAAQQSVVPVPLPAHEAGPLGHVERARHIAKGDWLVHLLPPSVVEFGVYDRVPLREATSLAKEGPAKLPLLKKVIFGGIEGASAEQEMMVVESFAARDITCEIYGCDMWNWKYSGMEPAELTIPLSWRY